MDKAYWLARKKASLELAEAAVSSQARLIHYDLAGRYDLKASTTEAKGIDLADCLPLSIDASRRY